MERVREAEKGRSERPKMRRKEKRRGFDKGSRKEEIKGDAWMDGSMSGQMDVSG